MQGSLQGEKELQREEYENMQKNQVTHMDSCTHVHTSHCLHTCCSAQGQIGLRGGLSLCRAQNGSWRSSYSDGNSTECDELVLELLSEWCVCVFLLSVDLQGVCSVQM